MSHVTCVILTLGPIAWLDYRWLDQICMQILQAIIRGPDVPEPGDQSFGTNHSLQTPNRLFQFFGLKDPKHFWTLPFATFFLLHPKVFPTHCRSSRNNKIQFLSFVILFAKNKFAKCLYDRHAHFSLFIPQRIPATFPEGLHFSRRFIKILFI